MSRSPLYIKNVSTLLLFSDLCIGCGTCLSVCPHQVLKLVKGKVALKCLDACMECGACALNCPAKAITVNSGVGCASSIILTALGLGSQKVCC
ncbi:mercury methylation ferredoxin HgcB [Dethiosulfatarculus sandiegensis]|uniref:4Fe-4S ferredoxin-type domain-containing protein n=1 Tax=Dethiosulfatarculus sandiegensis TaxID=1429043 RepID=A0A0D2GCD2_9BACT|nr:mercury methylation ferredoxin HgcB [Dethiosulfatarculus sandiegensis]KIX12537.1 hypothetical protein X474_18205 [Dethiosulfatarculus sandiegensis]